jgi:hypothetical protein
MGNQNGGMAKDSLEGRDVRQLDQHVSAALARGVKYNMKILIRGQVAQHACEASRVRPSRAEPAPACAVSMCRWGRASDAEVRPHRVCVCVCVCVCVSVCVRSGERAAAACTAQDGQDAAAAANAGPRVRGGLHADSRDFDRASHLDLPGDRRKGHYTHIHTY